MRFYSIAIVSTLTFAACAKPKPHPRSTPKLPPLSAAEMQRMVTGAVRLERACSEKDAETGLYVIRLIVAPDGRVATVTPLAAPDRTVDPARYSGLPHYIDAGPTPKNPVTRCYAEALTKLHFRAFSGPPVGFDHPVVVDKAPPSEAESPSRRCESDEECVFATKVPCTTACDDCAYGWRRAINRATAKRLATKWASKRWRKRNCLKRPQRRCKSCPQPLRGQRALCLNGQCTVR